MGIKNAVDKGIKNTKDAITESGHRSVAETERAMRESVGDEMTTTEKAKSIANETKHTVQAEYDSAKRNARSKK